MSMMCAVTQSIVYLLKQTVDTCTCK